ncbi:valine--tRNA ligase, mitochondrial-like [Argopecten irradians]|uniref:valine--tRNA ligase, mitochondrial-like n=1 Tax=Argopecten irradians TaxID=31199 RepID=UPI003719CD93
MGHIDSKRRMCNKIWQGFHFFQSNLGPDFKPAVNFKADVTASDLMDQWILSRLSHMVMSCDTNFQDYKLHGVTESLQTFWINDFCDIYLESVKAVLRENTSRANTVRQVMCFCIDTFVRALSPFMPYLSEELYQRLPMATDRPESVCISSYPSIQHVSFLREKLEEAVSTVKLLKTIILSAQVRYSIKSRTLPVVIQVNDGELLQTLSDPSLVRTLQTLSKAGSVHLLSPHQAPPTGSLTLTPNSQLQVFLKLKGFLNPLKEIERLENKLKRLEKTMKNKSKRKKDNTAEFAKLQEERDSYIKEIADMKKYEMEQTE